MTPISIADYRNLAQKRLPRMVFDYLDGGAGDERGVARNVAAFSAITLTPRRLVDVSKRSAAVSLFGRPQNLPFVLGPTGLNGALWPDGDVVLAKLAQKAGIPFVLSSAATTTIEDVASRAGGELWFQLYVLHRALAGQLVQRTLAAGYRTLVLTVDAQVNGKRERDLRNRFGVPFRLTARSAWDCARHPSWSLAQLRHGLPQLANFASTQASDASAQAALMARQLDASFNWDDLKALRDAWPHRLVVKGVLHKKDVLRCAGLGVDGVVLSNHGGRQWEDAPAAISVLPEIAAATSMPLLIDGGIRRGSDVVKALAWGAQSVLLGRAILYGLAARGAEGAQHALAILTAEYDVTLAQIGCASAADLTRDIARPATPSGG